MTSRSRSVSSGDEPPRDAGGEQGVTVGHHTHGLHQIGGFGVLHQESGGPGAHGLEDVLVEFEGGQHHHPYLGKFRGRGDFAGGGQPVQHRHANIHEHHIRAEFPGQPHRLFAIGGLADYLDIVLRVQQCRESGAYQRLIIGDHDPNTHETSSRTAAAQPPVRYASPAQPVSAVPSR